MVLYNKGVIVKTKIGIGVGAALAAALLVAAPAVALTDTTDDEKSSREELTRATLPLAHGTDLETAVQFSDSLGLPVVALAFDNGNLVGEYSALGGLGTDEYLKIFAREYGTQPEVHGVVVEVPTKQAKDLAQQRVAPIGAELPKFDAAPVSLGGLTLERFESAGIDVSEPASDGLISPMSVGDWRPDSTTHNILESGGMAMFAQLFTWEGAGHLSLPNSIGLEFEINEDNGSVATPQNVRPLCFDVDYKSRFWARNYGWSWSALDYWSGNASGLGAYADYNDATDLCRTNSIAIGLRDPKNLSTSGPNTQLDLFIMAPLGLNSSSRISGNVQAVSSDYCYDNPWLSNTDCMGVSDITLDWNGYPYGTYNRGTLNITRNIYVPSHCWATWNHGSNYQSYSCY